MLFGIFAGTAHSGWVDLVRNTGIAIAGNLVGGVGLVFTTRLAQVRSEPNSSSGTHDEAKETGRGS
jgi:formate/nitrite transporter FocA (FNT family)